MLIQFAFSTFFQRRFNVVKVISNVGSTLKQRHFARWVQIVHCLTDSSCGLMLLNVFPELESTKFPLIKA